MPSLLHPNTVVMMKDSERSTTQLNSISGDRYASDWCFVTSGRLFPLAITFNKIPSYTVNRTGDPTLVRTPVACARSESFPAFISSLITKRSTCETGPELCSLNCELTVNIIRAVPHTRDCEEQEVCPRAVTTEVCEFGVD